MSKKLNISILFFIISILAISSVSAYSFDVAYTTIKDNIYISEGAEFEVTIVNNEDQANRFRVSVEDFTQWSIETIPQSYKLSGVSIPANKADTFKLIFYPKNIRPGQKSVKVVVKSEETEDEIGKSLNINLKSEYSIPSFIPNIELKVYAPNQGKVDPRLDNVYKVEVKNKNLLILDDITVTLKSSLLDETQAGIKLEPLERRLLDFPVTLDRTESPKTETLIATATIRNQSFVAIQDYEIIPYKEDFAQIPEKKSQFLKITDMIHVTNNGNSEQVQTIKAETGFLKSLFCYTKPRADVVKEQGQRYFVWNLTLDSKETKTLSATLNFRPIISLILVILIAFALYYYLRSPIVITKDYADVSTQDGGISKLDVVLNIRNRSKKSVSNIEIIDKIPSLAHLEKEVKAGSLHPSKIIRHERKGTMLKWDIESLEEGEERIIKYTMRAKLAILGGFTIPPAIVRFKTDKGIDTSAKSNVLRINPHEL